MANQLKKLADVTYSAGRPYIPAQSAYCYWESYQREGTWELRTSTQTFNDGGTIVTITSSWYEYVPGGSALRRVCVPAVIGQTAIPSGTSYSAIIGWNSGGRSVDPLAADGYFEFKVGASPIGVVVGLVAQNFTTLPNEPTHAFYAHDTTVDVYESGVTIATAPTPFDRTKPMRISRSGSQITYSYDGWEHISAVPAVGPQYLDASMYYTGDSVNDPVLGFIAPGDAEGSGTFAAMDGLASDFDYGVDGGYAQGTGVFPRMTGAATGVLYGYGEGSGSFQPMSGLAADHAYAGGFGSFEPLTGDATGGFDAPAFSYGYGIMAPLSGSGTLLVGETGTGTGTFPAMDGLASDYLIGYMQGEGSFQSMQGFGVLLPPSEDQAQLANGIVFVDTYFTPTIMVREIMHEGLSIAGEFSATVSVSDSYVDALMLQDSFTFSQTIQAMINAGLLLASNSRVTVPATQYAVNVLTGALATYQGFDFLSFARAGGNTYACRADGMYLVRPGDDNGSPIDIDIDFGASSYGSVNTKTIEDVFLGLSTDGQVYLRVTTDDVEYRYNVIAREPASKAVLGRGVSGRRWNLALEITDATSMELDYLEVIVTPSVTRRAR